MHKEIHVPAENTPSTTRGTAATLLHVDIAFYCWGVPVGSCIAFGWIAVITLVVTLALEMMAMMFEGNVWFLVIPNGASHP
jgi:hypothetical protein